MPEGSSSDAPVISPGPIARMYWRHFGPDSNGNSSLPVALAFLLRRIVTGVHR